MRLACIHFPDLSDPPSLTPFQVFVFVFPKRTHEWKGEKGSSHLFVDVVARGVSNGRSNVSIKLARGLNSSPG